MIQSMTGFGSAEAGGFRVDIRSLNHRYLEISLKAPAFLNEHEMTFRAMLRRHFSRGKLDVSITVAAESGAGPAVNAEAAGRILRELRELQRAFAVPGEIDINTLAGFHEHFIGTDARYDADHLRAVFGQAVERLAGMRRREGEALHHELASLVDELSGMNRKVRSLSSAAVPDAARRLRERLQAVLEGRELDENRIVQEAALIAVRFDITEELARIDSHVEQFRATLAAGDVVGRKLDFLTQELNREANTIGSKAAETPIINEIVEMKACIERIKEQVQNVQ